MPLDIGDVAERIAVALGARAVDSAEEYASRFGRRHPRALRFARIVGGASLVLVGVLDAVMAIVAFAVVASGEGLGAESLFILAFLAWGVGLFVWGVRVMYRGLAS